jgi:hypothetical protein
VQQSTQELGGTRVALDAADEPLRKQYRHTHNSASYGQCGHWPVANVTKGKKFGIEVNESTVSL